MHDTITPTHHGNACVINYAVSSGDRNSEGCCMLVPEGGTRLTVLSGAVDDVVYVRCRRRVPVRSRSPGDEDGAHQGIVSLKCFLKMSFGTRRLAF